MNFEIEEWLGELTKRIRKAFGDRVLFIGNTGSYARGESTEKSDIDVNVILDKVDMDDLKRYRRIVQSMPYSQKACGFICGRQEMENWPAQEIFQFTMGCAVLYGSLQGIVPSWSEKDLVEHIRNMASAMYHESCHRYIYGFDIATETEALAFAYKNVFFVLQEWVYVERKQYIPTKWELMEQLGEEDSVMLGSCMNWDELSEDRKKSPEEYFARMKNWSGGMLLRAAEWNEPQSRVSLH